MKLKNESSIKPLARGPSKEDTKTAPPGKTKGDMRLKGKKLSMMMMRKQTGGNMESLVEEAPSNRDQLQPRFLYALNPNMSRVWVSHNFQTRHLEKNENVPQLIVHFSSDSIIVSKDSDEFKNQEEIQEQRDRRVKTVVKTHELRKNITYGNEELEGKHYREARAIIRNKFNYSQISLQTAEKIIRERGISTLKPQLINFAGSVDQSVIFDAYKAHLQGEKHKNEPAETGSSLYAASFRRCLRIMERMVVQNENKEKFHEYRYLYADIASPKSENDQEMCPLWRFSHPQSKRDAVTALSWSPRYADLFAVGFGTFDFQRRQGPYTLALFSLKNSTYPELAIPLEDSITCLEFSFEEAALIAVGLANGKVLVFDIRSKRLEPLYSSSEAEIKHSDIVWQIRWRRGYPKRTFCSVSADGHVISWQLKKDKIDGEEIGRLRFLSTKKTNKEVREPLVGSLAVGLCLEFCPADPYFLLIGTEEGGIYLCSSTNSAEYEMIYDGHQLAVYKLRFHPLLEDMFLSASADWTLKIWTLRKKQALMSFDIRQPAMDTAWSPFNAALFVALSSDKLYVYDLSVNRQIPIAEIYVKSGKCTILAFNTLEPTLLIGDNFGSIFSFKLGPRLHGDTLPGTEDNPTRMQQVRKYIELGSMLD